MTLRVKIEIVPFGDESRTKELYRFDIYNKDHDFTKGKAKYGVIELDIERKTGGLWDRLVYHERRKGAVELARHVLQLWGKLQE